MGYSEKMYLKHNETYFLLPAAHSNLLLNASTDILPTKGPSAAVIFLIVTGPETVNHAYLSSTV